MIIIECYEYVRKVINENKILLDNIVKYLIVVEIFIKIDIDEIVFIG